MTATILPFRRPAVSEPEPWKPIRGTYAPPPEDEPERLPLPVAMRRVFVVSAAFWATCAWLLWRHMR